MPLPDYEPDGLLPPGIHNVSLRDVLARCAVGPPARARQGELLRQVVKAATAYPTIKRVLVWGSFVTDKPEPNDLDYSVVVSVRHARAVIAPEHRRFFVPPEARQYYGADTGFLVIRDFPLEDYIDRLDFLCHTRPPYLAGRRVPCGILEVGVRGEVGEGQP